jgi:hypothetical protein
MYISFLVFSFYPKRFFRGDISRGGEKGQVGLIYNLTRVWLSRGKNFLGKADF